MREASGHGVRTVVDVAGPTMFVVETTDLEQLAAGHVLTPTSLGHAWLVAPAQPGRGDVTGETADW
ncbi:MAG: hypothetical protein ABJA81_04840 [Nocardioidaceae bacterium]